MGWFKYVWLIMILAIYVGWFINVCRMKKGMSWIGWFDEYFGPWLFVQGFLIFIASMMVWAFSRSGG